MLALCLASCGYRMISEKGIWGGDVVHIELPMFKNMTRDPHISSYVTDAFSSEILSTGLLEIRSESPAILKGEIVDVRVSHEAFGKAGLVREKRVELFLTLSLYREGNLLKRWDLRDSETYLVEDRNLEDYMKREAIKRVSRRMARNFTLLLLKEY